MTLEHRAQGTGHRAQGTGHRQRTGDGTLATVTVTGRLKLTSMSN